MDHRHQPWCDTPAHDDALPRCTSRMRTAGAAAVWLTETEHDPAVVVGDQRLSLDDADAIARHILELTGAARAVPQPRTRT